MVTTMNISETGIENEGSGSNETAIIKTEKETKENPLEITADKFVIDIQPISSVHPTETPAIGSLEDILKNANPPPKYLAREVEMAEQLYAQSCNPQVGLAFLLASAIPVIANLSEILNQNQVQWSSEKFRIAYLCGAVLNIIEDRMRNQEGMKKTAFTEWRAKNLPNIGIRTIQDWQRVARLGELALAFSSYGIYAVLELEYADEQRTKEFSEISVYEMVKTIRKYASMESIHTQRKIVLRNALDATVTEFRLRKKINPANFAAPDSPIDTFKTEILDIVKELGESLESNDIQKISDAITPLQDAEKQKQYLLAFANNKCVEHRTVKEEARKRLKSLSEPLIRFNKRFQDREAADIKIDIAVCLETIKNLMSYTILQDMEAKNPSESILNGTYEVLQSHMASLPPKVEAEEKEGVTNEN